MSNTGNPFDWLKSITQTKEYMMEDEVSEKSYNSFLVNRGLSYFPDTIFHSNVVNGSMSHADNKFKYDYLYNSISKRKRFSSWASKKSDENLNRIKYLYSVSDSRAQEILNILNKSQIDEIVKLTKFLYD